MKKGKDKTVQRKKQQATSRFFLLPLALDLFFDLFSLFLALFFFFFFLFLSFLFSFLLVVSFANQGPARQDAPPSANPKTPGMWHTMMRWQIRLLQA